MLERNVRRYIKALLNVRVRYGRHKCSKSRVCWLRTGTLSSSMNVIFCEPCLFSVSLRRLLFIYFFYFLNWVVSLIYSLTGDFD